MDDTFGHTPLRKALGGDVYGIEYDPERASRRPVRLAIIGAGGVAQSKYFPAIARLRMIWEPVAIVAFAEPRETQARKVQEIYGGRWYDNHRTMLAEEEIDGVVVLSPDKLHPEHAIAALRSGLDVLVEKPLARSLSAAAEMCRTAAESGRHLMTVATWRHAPPYRQAFRYLRNGPVSDPALFAGKFTLGYDYVDLLESGTIHLFDLARHFMGDVASVMAMGTCHYPGDSGYALDNATLALRFTSGAVGTLYTSSTALSMKPWARVEVYGNHAWLAVEDNCELRLYAAEEAPTQIWTPVMTNTLLFDEEFGGFMGLMENFLQVIRGADEPLATGWDGYRAYELLAATKRSLARGAPVQLPLNPSDVGEETLRHLARQPPVS